MAFDFSKLNILSRLDARARVFVLFLILLGIIIIVYFITAYFAGGNSTVGPSRVANVPGGIQSVPGSKNPTAEYQRAYNQANLQIAEAAKMSGSSALATQVYTGTNAAGCIICSDKSADVKNILSDLVRQGKITPEVADALQKLANQNVSPEEYADYLSKLVKQGKLTPEQARDLLEEYKKQHANVLLGNAEKTMDGLIKSGQLPIDAANELLDAQKRNVSPSDYAAMLQRMVKEGKISPAVAAQLLQQYNKQCVEEAISKHVVLIRQMSENGSLTQDVATQLIALTDENVALEVYTNKVNTLVSQGKLTPVAAGNLIDAFRMGKTQCGMTGTIDQLLRQAENEAFQELSDLLAAGKITAETAAQITSLIQNNVPMDEFKAAINQLQQQKKLTPEIAQLKIGDYVKVKNLRDAQQALASLQANNVSPADYAEQLKKLVAAGIITPEQAAQLLQEYQAKNARVPTGTVATGAFGALQQRVAQGETATGTVNPDQFAVTPEAAGINPQVSEDKASRLAALVSAMTNQASQLVSAWQTAPMSHQQGSYADAAALAAATTTTTTTTTSDGSKAASGESETPPLIKSGTILFGVLDTAINSDYPDSPILVTIVDGKYKGAKLLGKIVTTKGVSGQMDRVSLNFTMMNDDEWVKSKSVTAYAIDPDTARTVMASTVDYHYLMRFGAIMGTAFLQGYASAITNAGTSVTTVTGTSTTHPALSSSEKMMTALGQVGTTLGNATQNYVNRPPTVRVDSGVSLGILFMSDVT